MPLLKSLVKLKTVSPEQVPEVQTPRDTEVSRPTSIIKKVLDAQDRVPEKARTHKGYIHLTGLVGACPRALAIGREGNTTPVQNVTGAHRLMWATGRAVEAHIRATYIKAVNFKGVFGIWRCDCRQLTMEGFWKDHRACPHCKRKAKNYYEYPLIDHDAGVVGNPDMLILDSKDKMMPVEIKSIKGEGWDALEDAEFAHKVQMSGYHRLLAKCGFTPSDWGSVLYGKKSFKWGSPYKEFIVNPNDANVQSNLNLMWSTAEEVQDKNRIGLPAKCNTCAQPEGIKSTKAKNCPYVGECFVRD